MDRRRRALAFLTLALVCGTGAAALAARYRGGVEEGYGPLRPIVVVERALEHGDRLSAGDVDARLGSSRVPQRFVPADALSDPSQAVGSEPLGPVPAGSYLLASHLRDRRSRQAPGLGAGRRPIEARVAAAGALARSGDPTARVDVVAAEEPGVGARPRVVVLARRVPLLDLRRSSAEVSDRAGGWVATLGLSRGESLAVIEAENFSRELRLLPR